MTAPQTGERAVDRQEKKTEQKQYIRFCDSASFIPPWIEDMYYCEQGQIK